MLWETSARFLSIHFCFVQRRVDGIQEGSGGIAGGAGICKVLRGLIAYNLAGQIIQGGLHQRVHGGDSLA